MSTPFMRKRLTAVIQCRLWWESKRFETHIYETRKTLKWPAFVIAQVDKILFALQECLGQTRLQLLACRARTSTPQSCASKSTAHDLIC